MEIIIGTYEEFLVGFQLKKRSSIQVSFVIQRKREIDTALTSSSSCIDPIIYPFEFDSM